MATGSWQGSRFDFRDYNPHRRPERDAAAEVFRQRRADRERRTAGAIGTGEIQSWRYRKPLGKGEHLVEHPTDPSRTLRVASAQGAEAFNPGQRVLMGVTMSGASILGNPPGGDKGAANTPVSRATGSIDIFGITSASPSLVPQGQTAATTFKGFGFLSGDVLTAVVYNADSGLWETDTDITIANFTFVDSETATADITAASSLPVGYLISYRLERAS